MASGSTGPKPLASSAFYILLALADEERHGLGIADEIERRTDGDIQLGPGTLYHTVKRLLADGLIAEPATPTPGDPRRRYYHITDDGRAALQTEAARLDRVLAAVRAKRVPLPSSKA